MTSQNVARDAAAQLGNPPVSEAEGSDIAGISSWQHLGKSRAKQSRSHLALLITRNRLAKMCDMLVTHSVVTDSSLWGPGGTRGAERRRGLPGLGRLWSSGPTSLHFASARRISGRGTPGRSGVFAEIERGAALGASEKGSQRTQACHRRSATSPPG